MPKTYTYPGKLARYELGAAYLVIMILVFGVHIQLSEQLFPSDQEKQRQITEEVQHNG